MTVNLTDNTLFPVFMKLSRLNLLIVGGGYVASEKLNAVFKSSPDARVRIVATTISDDVKQFIQSKNIAFKEKAFDASDLAGIDLCIIAIDDRLVSEQIHSVCKAQKVLTNVADKPDLCDFYLGSIVQKGNLKLAISTNGKSPTIAKRVKEVLADAFPDEIDDLLNNMEQIRQQLRGDFSEKIKQLNQITSVLTANTKSDLNPDS